nr:immunoglobulin light chain junction region [Macaca mulatta]MOY12283.1 immunoglobulin light chain junction region [Macaca mulatta]MOY14282.1 immunoglobulin light chain junction region [Macaca mulatta]
CQQYHGLLTF